MGAHLPPWPHRDRPRGSHPQRLPNVRPQRQGRGEQGRVSTSRSGGGGPLRTVGHGHLGRVSLHPCPARPRPASVHCSSLPRFKQLLLTQADKFSQAEVRVPGPSVGCAACRALGRPRGPSPGARSPALCGRCRVSGDPGGEGWRAACAPGPGGESQGIRVLGGTSVPQGWGGTGKGGHLGPGWALRPAPQAAQGQTTEGGRFRDLGWGLERGDQGTAPEGGPGSRDSPPRWSRCSP